MIFVKFVSADVKRARRVNDEPLIFYEYIYGIVLATILISSNATTMHSSNSSLYHQSFYVYGCKCT